MKAGEEIMHVFEAFDLTGCYRDAGELAGCDHHTPRYVAAREEGRLSAVPARRDQLIDPWLPKLEEWMEASKGKIRADVAHKKLRAMGYGGSERTTRRAVAVVRRAWAAGHRRVHRPWVPEPGLWFQWDYADGPIVAGVSSSLFCAWLAWRRFRVVLPIRDKTPPTVVASMTPPCAGSGVVRRPDYVPRHVIRLFPVVSCGRRRPDARRRPRSRDAVPRRGT